MHIAEGYLPPLHAAIWWGISLPFLHNGIFAGDGN